MSDTDDADRLVLAAILSELGVGKLRRVRKRLERLLPPDGAIAIDAKKGALALAIVAVSVAEREARR